MDWHPERRFRELGGHSNRPALKNLREKTKVTSQSSASKASGQPSWLYTRPAFGRTGRSLSENNFAKERRDWLAILLREVLQNGLDAKRQKDTPVTVRLAAATAHPSITARLCPPNHLDRLARSLPHSAVKPETPTRFLVIEDFGTSGLVGRTDDPELDGPGQNWNAFWFREGEGGKEHGAGNGGAGQGKITYFSTSAIRTIFAYTVRSDDNTEALFGASSFLRDYEYDGHKCLRDAYWGVHAPHDGGVIATPTSDTRLIDLFRSELGVSRKAGQAGLSLVIPDPKDFAEEDAVRIVIAEFFAPIFRGDLVVEVGAVTLDASNIEEQADIRLSDEQARALRTCTTKGFREFFGQALTRSKDGQVSITPALKTVNDLSEATFDPAVLSQLRSQLDSELPIAVRFQIAIKPQKGQILNCHFDVHLVKPAELQEIEQAVLRRDLLIGEEPIGGGGLRQRARALTLIDDAELSKLLLSAEEATHLRWNARLPRLSEYYKSGAAVVAFVRNAAAKLLEVLTGGDQRRDFRLLAKYFAAPGTLAHVVTKGKKAPKGREPPTVGPIPPPAKTLLALLTLEDGCRVTSTVSLTEAPQALPIRASLEFAYEGLDRDAFAEYDPLDFDLADSSFSIKANGCTPGTRALNRFEFEVMSPDFELSITGFDPNIRLRVRLNYKEASDAEVIEAE